MTAAARVYYVRKGELLTEQAKPMYITRTPVYLASDYDALQQRCSALEAALSKARVELSCLFTAAEMKKDRIDLCDVPPEPNDADKECIAAAFNVIRLALSRSTNATGAA